MIAAYLLATLMSVSLLMGVAWYVSQRTGKSGFTVMFWTYGAGAAGMVLALAPVHASQGPDARQVLVAAILGVWSLRLGTHILLRTLKGGDDPRYAKLKQEWGSAAPRRMFWFLQVQALTMALMALAVCVAARAPRPGLDWPPGRDPQRRAAQGLRAPAGP
jgi:steroid 5-alpha reductase family enzyme